MAYAVIADVQALLPKFTLGAATKPTSTQATAIINDVSVEIDAALAGAGYAVPVTTPTWFVDYLGLVNQYGAAAAILKAMFPEAAAASDDTIAIYTFWEARYQKALKSLRDGSTIPAGLAAGSAQVKPSTYFTRNPDEEEDLGDIAEPFFKRGTVF